MPSIRMSHVGICVSDRVRSLRFYHDVLGFRFVSEQEVEGRRASTLLRLDDVGARAIFLEREGVRIDLLYYETPGHEGDRSPRAMNQLGLTHLSFRVDDLDATLAEFAEAGVAILPETRIDGPGRDTKAVFITDPDGTLIELSQQQGD